MELPVIFFFLLAGTRADEGMFEVRAREVKPLRYARLTYLLRQREIFEPVCPCAPPTDCDSFCCYCQLGCEGKKLKSCESPEEHLISDPVDRAFAFALPNNFSDSSYFFSLWVDNSVVFGNYVLWRRFDPLVPAAPKYPAWTTNDTPQLTFYDNEEEIKEMLKEQPLNEPSNEEEDSEEEYDMDQFPTIPQLNSSTNFSELIRGPDHSFPPQWSLGRPGVSGIFTSNVQTSSFQNCSHLRTGVEEETEKFIGAFIPRFNNSRFLIQRSFAEIEKIGILGEKTKACSQVPVRLHATAIYKTKFLVGLNLRWWRSEVELGQEISFQFSVTSSQLRKDTLSGKIRFWAELAAGRCVFGSCWRDVVVGFYPRNFHSFFPWLANFVLFLLPTLILYDLLDTSH